MALTTTGQLLASGYNREGELGNGTTTTTGCFCIATPVQVSLPAGTTITAVAAGDYHSLALTSTGQVLAWGDNLNGELGNGTTANSSTPVPVSLPMGTTVTAIAGGANHSLALTSTGQVLAWGQNTQGQLGNGTVTDSSTPVLVSLPSGTTATVIASGFYHSLAVTSTGGVLAWGNNFDGELGNGTTTTTGCNCIPTPVQVSPSTLPVTRIAGGGFHSLALTTTGQVLAWGANFYGQLGNSTTTTTGCSCISTPVQVNLPSGTIVTAITGGFFHSLALTSTGSVLAWGHNDVGQLGNGTYADSSTPIAVNLPSGTAITTIAAAGHFSLAVQIGAVAVFPAMTNGAYGGYVTAVTIQNTGSAPALIQIAYFDQNGAPVGTGDAVTNLPVNASWTVRQDNGNSFPGSGGDAVQAGSAVVYSSQPIASFVNEFAPGNVGDATSYSGVQVPSGVGASLFAPNIVNNAYGGYTTGIGLVNEGSSPTDVTITYRDGGGAAIKTQFVSALAAHAYTALYSGDAKLPNGFAGTATITSSGGQVLGAIVNEAGPGGQFSSYDAVPSGSRLINVPVALNNAYGGYNTGLAIQNISAFGGTVTVTYYDGSGVANASTVSIAANGSLGVYQGSANSGLKDGGAYTAVIQSSTVWLAAIVNEVAPAGAGSARQSTSFNTFATGAAALHLALVENGGSDPWNTGDGIMNTGTTSTTVTVRYYDSTTGGAVGTAQSRTLSPHAFWGLYQPIGGLPSGSRATAVVSASAGGQLAVICNESSSTSFMSYDGR